MELFGIVIPLWALFIGIIIIAFIVWKVIKFAIKALIFVVIFFVILIGLDLLNVFTWINENILTYFL
jgi:hypothetical protein